MTDILTKEQRSCRMKAIRGKDTKPEMIVRKYLFSKGLRYRVHMKQLQGRPDIVLKKYKTVIFIDGCFWHGHDGCKYFKIPKSNELFWQQKIKFNKARDIATDYVLQTQGWNVIRVWECDLRTDKKRKETLESLYNQILSSRKYSELSELSISMVAESNESYR
ncbi:MAG: DNA mismatch endonuclease Vsr [Muribaculaceae bacterium]|nr:DNA mismatch endonuclease Vsr [Muribaculaceae bacterium]